MLPCVSLQCSFPGQLILERERTWIYVTAGYDGIFCTVQISQSFSLILFYYYFFYTYWFEHKRNEELALSWRHLHNHAAATTHPHGKTTRCCAQWNTLIFLSCLPWSCTENPLGFNTAAGQLFFPGHSLVVPYRWRTSLLPLDIFHTDADVCFKKPSC